MNKTVATKKHSEKTIDSKNTFLPDNANLIVVPFAISLLTIMFLPTDPVLTPLTTAILFIMKTAQMLLCFYKIIPYRLSLIQPKERATVLIRSFIVSGLFTLADMIIFKFTLISITGVTYTQSIGFQWGFFTSINLLLGNATMIAYLIYNNADPRITNRKSFLQRKEPRGIANQIPLCAHQTRL